MGVSDRESKLISTLTMLMYEDGVKAAVWKQKVCPLPAVCLILIWQTLVRRQCAALPAWGASCGLFLFNPLFLPRSPYFSQEMKCDFHLLLLSMNVIVTPLSQQYAWRLQLLLIWRFLNADWLEGCLISLPLQLLFGGILITTEIPGLSSTLASEDSTITLLHFWQQEPLQLYKLGPNFLTSLRPICPSWGIMVTQAVKVSCKQCW